MLSAELCVNALADVNAVFTAQLRLAGLPSVAFEGEEALHANMQKLFTADVDAYLATVRHLNKLLSIQDLLFQGAVRAFVAELGLSLPSVPTNPVVSIMSDRLRIQGGYFGLAPHQDWPSIQGSLDAVVIWTPLMDVDVERFPLAVIPRSHDLGLWDGVNTPSAREISPQSYRESDFIPVEMRRGDILFMTTFTVHRTGVTHGSTACSGLRIACNTRIENSAEATFVERRYPCAYRRTVERELITDAFPSRQQVKNALCA
jgi:hypothetical protein